MEQYKKTLIISAKQLKLSSTIELNVDEKILHSVIFDTQNIELKAILQTELYNHLLLSLYTNKTTGQALPADIVDMLDDYIKPFLVNAALCDFIYTNQFKLSNAGTNKATGSGFQAVTPVELETAVQHYRAKKATYKKILIDYLKSRKLLSKNADVQQGENFGFFIPDNDVYGNSIIEENGVQINDIVGMDFVEDTGELFLISQSAQRITTNLDGRYRLSKTVEDVIHSGTFTLLQFNPEKSKGAYIDYVVQQGSNQRTGRVIANWIDELHTMTDYASSPIGQLPIVIFLDYTQERVVFNITSQANDVFVRLIVTEI